MLMRRILLNLLTLFTSMVLFLAVAEAILWGVAPPPKPAFPKGMFQWEAGTWRLTPGFTGITDNRADFTDKRVTADALGRRIVPAAPADAPKRLWLLGDSQTFGHGLADEETWANRLQEEFNRQGRAITVINLGVPAINVDQYITRLRHTIGEIRPGDAILVGLSWNDIITPQQVERENIQVVDGYLVNAAPQMSQTALKARVVLFDATGIALPPFQDLKSFVESLSNTSALMHFLYPRVKALYYRYRSVRPLDAIMDGKVPEANFYLLAEMAALARDRGASFTVLSLPDKIFFEDQAYAVYSVNGRDFPQQNYPGHVIQPLCRHNHIACLDAFDILHQHQFDPVAYAQDGHYNPQGARVIAAWLATQPLFQSP
jgi:lysophospholipase L1-like esterase